jgi:hypothetical protein
MRAVGAVKDWLAALVSPADTHVVNGEMPKGTEDIRKRFLDRRDDKHEKLTRLQERMQSGG